MVQQGINLDVQRIIGYKQFCNKLWNINKFALRNFDANFKPSSPKKLSLSEKWILTRLSALITKTNEQFVNYDFGNMSQAIYDFWYKDLADNYLEACKPAMSGNDEEAKNAVRNTLFVCLDSALRLLHPTMPYITEELYQRLPDRANAPESITIAPFPTSCPSFANEGVEETFDTLIDLVKKFRSQLTALNITR
jgi:valyl-tRNA synthetase